MQVVVLDRRRQTERGELSANVPEVGRERTQLRHLLGVEPVIALEERLVRLDDDGQAQVAETHRKELLDVCDLGHLELAVQRERA